MFSRILVGIDDSQPSKDAVVLAARLAREHGGRLMLCHSVNWLPLMAQMEPGTVADQATIIDGLKQQGEALLAQAAEAAKLFSIDAERHNVEGEPAESLLKLADEAECRLIVMGTHGRRGLGHMFIGSTTEAVLRGSMIPVLAIRTGERIASTTRRCFERIIVGIDDSDPSDAAIKTVLELPAEDRRRILFCSVADVNTFIGLGAQGYYYTKIRGDLYDQAQRIVDSAVASVRSHGVTAEGQVVEGSTSDELIAVAKEQEADLIVMGSHGRRGMQRLFLGSVAESVVRTAPVPVLVVRTAVQRSDAVDVTSSDVGRRSSKRSISLRKGEFQQAVTSADDTGLIAGEQLITKAETVLPPQTRPGRSRSTTKHA